MVLFAFVGALVGIWSELLRRHMRELEWLNEHHPVTGMLNMSGLLKRLDTMVQADQPLAVSVIQLHAFLEIQNTFGVDFGMRMLAAVVEGVKAVLPKSALVALIQPDRIATVIEDGQVDPRIRDRVQSAITDSYVLDGIPIHVEASIGVAYYAAHTRTSQELLQKASIAMQWAASTKTTIAVYDLANDLACRDNLILLGAIPAAIERGELEVWHQAKLCLASNTIAGTEALLRWKHPERGYIHPGRFIPQLEETSLMDPVTHLVIDAACKAAGEWRANGHPLRVSINLSVRNLLDRSLSEELERSCRSHGVQPGDVELEITESASWQIRNTASDSSDGSANKGTELPSMISGLASHR